MKSSELIKLRLQVVDLIYSNGTPKDRANLFDQARAMINFISTGNSIKKPVIEDKPDKGPSKRDKKKP